MRSKISVHLTLFILTISTGYSQIDNPFRSIGKEGEIITLSKGKYQEVHPYDSLQKIGSVIVNMNTGMIYKIVETDTLYSEATLDPTVISRWYSPDPLEAKYPGMSPYNFANNNPILYKDPDGRDAIVSVTQENGKTVVTFTSNIYLVGQDISEQAMYILNFRAQQIFGQEYSTNIDGQDYLVRFNVDYKNASEGNRAVQEYDKNHPNNKGSMQTAATSLIEDGKLPTGLEAEGYLPIGDNYLHIDNWSGNASLANGYYSKAMVQLNGNPDAQAYIIIHESLHLLGLDDRYNSYKDENGNQISENHFGYGMSIMSLYDDMKLDIGYGLTDPQIEHFVKGVQQYIQPNNNYKIPYSNTMYLQRFLAKNGNFLDDVDECKEQSIVDVEK